jgi:hypothetical protein
MLEDWEFLQLYHSSWPLQKLSFKKTCDPYMATPEKSRVELSFVKILDVKI